MKVWRVTGRTEVKGSIKIKINTKVSPPERIKLCQSQTKTSWETSLSLQFSKNQLEYLIQKNNGNLLGLLCHNYLLCFIKNLLNGAATTEIRMSKDPNIIITAGLRILSERKTQILWMLNIKHPQSLHNEDILKHTTPMFQFLFTYLFDIVFNIAWTIVWKAVFQRCYK